MAKTEAPVLPSLSKVVSGKVGAIDIESAAFLESVLNASDDCIKVLSMDGDLVFMNRNGMVLMEIDDFSAVQGCPWQSFWEDEHHQAAVEALATARSGGIGKFVGLADTYLATPKWWDVTVTPIFGDGGGTPTHLLSISRDITSVKTVELQREILAGELIHRVKNLLAVVGAIASQTFKDADSASVDSFTARLVALGEAQGLLVESVWKSAFITEVVEKALSPHAAEGRATVSGPKLVLSAKEALALALAVHELATNAVKYGALSNTIGVISVTWSIDGDRLTFRWTESGGPNVEPPISQGFGSRIITRNLAGEFKGKVEIDYKSTGLSLTLIASR